MRDTRIVQKFLNRADIKSGRKPEFQEFADYEGYANDKRLIEKMPLTAEEYEKIMKKSAELRGI